ncbi:hypothetical protein CPB85DRAFT_1364666 [Mucidula mucida]|nr:hypothetical protein CPB85DRAFT_1364666 [Mucidula mucida]
MSYYPSHYSPRDNYLAALARVKAVEQEYLAAEAIEQEERQIRRRLKELQFQRHRASQSSYDAPDRLSLLRLQLQEEERKQAEAGLLRRRNLQEQAAQLNQDRRERAQLELLNRSTNRTSTGKPGNCATIPAFRARYRARPSRHINPAAVYSLHALPEVNSSSSNIGLQELLHALSDGQPLPSARHYVAHVRTPTRVPVVQPVDAGISHAASMEQTLKVLFPNATLHFPHQPKIAPSMRPEENPTPNAPTVSPQSAVQESATTPLHSTDTAIKLQQILTHLFVDAVQACTPSEGQQAVPPQKKPPVSRSEIQRPTTPITSLKEQLETRLASEETTEVKDTIQAIFNSLSDATISVPSSAPSPTPSLKGKAKAEFIPESEDLVVSLARINSIESAYRSLIDDFTFPSHLDFAPSSSPASSDTEQSLSTKLAYTARNAPVRFHEQSLSGLLSQLDSIESFGDEGLRTKRKEVVGLVEAALEDLEREVEGRWRAKVAKDSVVANGLVEESMSSEEDSASVKSLPSTGPAPASAIAHPVAEPTVSDPTSCSVVEGQAASSPISASSEQSEPLDGEDTAIEDALEEDVSSDGTDSTDIESSADSFDDIEADTFRSGSTLTDSSTLKTDHDDQSLQVDEQRKGKVTSDQGSDWSEVEA